MFILFALIYMRALSVGLHCEQTNLDISILQCCNFFLQESDHKNVRNVGGMCPLIVVQRF